MRRSLCACLMMALCAWSFAVYAAGYVSDSAWLEDPSGTLTLPQVEAQASAFRTYTGVLTKGYTASTYWVRLRILPAAEDQLILRIRPAYIDHIELFDPLMQSGGSLVPLFGGDRYPRQRDEYQSLNHGFTIKASDYPRDIYLRLQTSSTMLIHAEVLSLAQASHADRRQELFYSAYLGILTAFMVWALVQWLASREPLILLFLGKQAVVLAHALAILGYLPFVVGEWFSAPSMDLMTSVLALSNVLISAVFLLLLVREFNPVPWIWRFFASILLLYLPLAVLFLEGRVRQALQVNTVIAGVESVGFLLVVLSARVWVDRQAKLPPLLPRWILISFSLMLLLGGASYALPSLGGVQGNEWSLNAPIFGGLINGFLMTLLLIMRARNQEKNLQQVRLELTLAEHEANSERQRREEEGRFLAMLTHELKTPLGVARISLGASKLSGAHRDRIERSLLNIDAIIERCRITDQLEHRQLLPQVESCELVALVDECVSVSIHPDRVKVLTRSPAPINSDPALLVICVANLMNNALKYSPLTSDVTVSVRRQVATVGKPLEGFVICIGNRIGSAGIPDAAQVFSKYYRSPGARRKSGSGLGLYLTHNIVQLLGGQLTYRVDGDQLEFCLWIPT